MIMKRFYEHKQHRLKGYNYSSNGSYFLTICVKNRECLLCDIVPSAVAVYFHGDRRHVKDTDTVNSLPDHAHPQKPTLILSEYGQVVKKHIENGKSKLNSLTVDTYVIMPNHIHMILTLCNDGLICPEKPCHDIIPKYISSLKTLITKEIGFPFFSGISMTVLSETKTNTKTYGNISSLIPPLGLRIAFIYNIITKPLCPLRA